MQSRPITSMVGIRFHAATSHSLFYITMELSRTQFFASWLIASFLLGVCLPLVGFIALASHVWNQGKGFVWDIPVLQWVHQTACPQLDAIAVRLTPLGIGWGVGPLLTLVGGVLLYHHHWRLSSNQLRRELLYLVITPSGSFLLNRTLKLFFHRERPHLWEVFAPDLSYAFPSGHAMSSTALVMVLIVLTWNTRWRWTMLVIGSLFVFAIGWTRIYLGMHYPSDVLAGWLLAIAWSISTMLVIHP